MTAVLFFEAVQKKLYFKYLKCKLKRLYLASLCRFTIHTLVLKGNTLFGIFVLLCQSVNLKMHSFLHINLTKKRTLVTISQTGRTFIKSRYSIDFYSSSDKVYL